MIKKIILGGVIFLCSSFYAFPQFNITITDSRIPDTHSCNEGDLKHYIVTITQSGTIYTFYQFAASVTNGTITQQSLIAHFPPLQPIELYVDIRWNCQVTAGSLTVYDPNSSSSATYNTTILFYINDPNYCRTATPNKQNLFYGQTPLQLDLVTCSAYCQATNDVTYQYQWQVGDVPIGVFPQEPPGGFTDIPNQTDKTYLPPTYYTSCIKAYRRLTRFTYLGLPYEYPSTTAVISTFDYLGGGTISGGTTFINGVPIINQTPATGGLCDGYYYSYTWELSLDNINWTTIGIGVVYPAGAQIPGTCYIRRRVDCGGQFAYSNVLNIIPPILIAGTISGGGTVTFNTIPLVTQTAASGSVCTAPDFIYTWERSVNNGAWLQFGTAGINYPANAGIIGTCKIRRKVHCIFEDGYSNEISFTMLPYTSPNAENLNYVRTNDIVIPSVHSWEQADNLITGDKLQTTSYLDGFGRPIQKVVKQGSLKQSNTPLDPNDINNYQDLVGYSEYDGLGRTDRAFLPYATQTNLGFFKSNAQTEQRDFTNTKYGEPVGSNFTFSQTTYDGSPLNRVTNVKLPGANWNNNPAYQGISSDYDFYDPTIENVINWEIAYNNGAVPKVSGIDYEAGSLIKNNITDEKGKIIYEYKDLSGNVILKKVQVDDNAEVKNYPGWLNTYYVYDDFGRLRYTITPQAVMEMYSSHDWTIYNNIKNGLCFYQEYDKKGRVIKKHSPDGGEVWLVYDNRDRLVLSQDENQRNRVNTTPSKPNQWSFSLYDENDRNVATGLINDARNRNDMQSFVDGLTNQNQPVEIYTGAWETITAYTPVAGKIPGTSAYYCQSCTASFTNSVSYYDDYSHRPSTQNYITLASNGNNITG